MMNSEHNVTSGNKVTITLDDYRDVGALDEALSTHADEVLRSLTEEQQRIAQVLFRRLTERGDGRRDRRRPSRLGDVAAVAGVEPKEVASVVEEFRRPDRSFITPPHGSTLKPETVLDISHESLISLWDTLDGWVEDEARSAAAYDRLKKTAYLWEAKDADPWGAITLERALTWKKKQQPTLEWARRYGTDKDYSLAMRFLEASEQAWQVHQQSEATRLQREHQDEIERQSLKEKAKNARKFKLLTAALGVLVIAALSMAGVARSESNRAEQSLGETVKQKQVAEQKTKEAELAAADARTQRVRAERNERTATENALEAQHQKELAQKSEKAARADRIKAEKAAFTAKEEKKRADENAGLATSRETIAKENEEKATRAKDKAEEKQKELEEKQKELEQQVRFAQSTQDDLKIANEELVKQVKQTEEGGQDLREKTALVAALKEDAVTNLPATSNERSGRLSLKLVDVYGKFLAETTSIVLHNEIVSDEVNTTVNPSTPTTLTNLLPFPRGVYRVEIYPTSYQPISRFVNIQSIGNVELSVTFPIDSAKVSRVEFPLFDKLSKDDQLSKDGQKLLENSRNVLGLEGISGKILYERLDDAPKAAFLNILAKTNATRLDDGKNALHYIKEIREISGNSVVAVVSKKIIDEAGDSVRKGLLVKVPSALHQPPEGFQSQGSFRTTDRYGSLQLTIFSNGDDYLADIDIDDEGGLGQIFQVNSSFTRRRATHPYDIHEILVFYQHLDPGYRLFP
jgi:chemotaxis protein histidine kinase CheA